MTTPPYQPGPYGQPNQEPYGQGGGYGQYGQPQPPQHGQPQYGGQYGAQQPQYGQQPQQPPPYGATQQWPTTNYGGLGQEPPEPPKNKTPMIVAIVVIAALVLGGGGLAIYLATKGDDNKNQATEQTKTPTSDKTTSSDEQTSEEKTTEQTSDEPAAGGDPYDAETGDCIKVNQGGDTNADVEVVSCSAAEAIYKVGTREEVDTADCPNDQYVTYTEEGRLLLCLQLNVAKGDCLQVSDVDTRVDCADPAVTDTVVDVLDGVDDETQCPAGATAVTYPTPALTVCLGKP